tara:strand:+ start:694 stop:1065 length:372 start_codon:yes stop_codon:yes gene_type:complete
MPPKYIQISLLFPTWHTDQGKFELEKSLGVLTVYEDRVGHSSCDLFEEIHHSNKDSIKPHFVGKELNVSRGEDVIRLLAIINYFRAFESENWNWQRGLSHDNLVILMTSVKQDPNGTNKNPDQ